MSGGDKTPDKLTDQQRIDQQVAVINVTNIVSEMTGNLFGHSGRPVLGKTNFEGHSLNAMVDLVHGTNPADLEHAGEALGSASKAINEAAEELRRHLKHAGEDWKGEAGTAFQKWGEKLATHTEALAKYADDANVQIAAAATGLASVRSAMPTRDTRPAGEQKKPGQFPEAKQVEGNRQYAEALQVEKDRQEAINQMNRLASFYSVSGGELGKLEPPVFEAMPDVGVRDPITPGGDGGRNSGGADSGAAHRAVTGVTDSRHVDVSHGDSGPTVLPTGQLAADTNVASHHPTVPTVGTEINSVSTLPLDTAQSAPVTPPSSGTGPGGPSAGPVSPVGTGPVPPAFGGPVGRSVGIGGTKGGRAFPSAQGRGSTSEGISAGARGARGPMGPVGRASAVGPQGARGPVSATGKSPIGRGVTGGMPKAAGATSPRTGSVPGGRSVGVTGQPTPRTGLGATGAARTGGVVGGKPTAEAGPNATGARVPRGTVIGGEGAPNDRPTGERPGQRGVIGGNNGASTNGQGQSPRRSLAGANRVVGASTERAGTRERTESGSTGRGARRQQRAAEDKKRPNGDAPSATD